MIQEKIITCLDGSQYTDSILSLNDWVADQLNLPTTLLHVAHPHADFAARPNLSGAIGLGAKTILLEELTACDEIHGKEEQEKGNLILENALSKLQETVTSEIEPLHIRGDFVESTIDTIKSENSILILGKRGEYTDKDTRQLGSNVEDLIRSTPNPILVASRNVVTPIKKFLLVCDTKEDTQKLVNFISSNNLLKDTECHLILLNNLDETSVLSQLNQHNIKVIPVNINEPSPEVIATHVKENDIQLLVTRSYRHSKLYDFIFGGYTNKLLHLTKIPMLIM